MLQCGMGISTQFFHFSILKGQVVLFFSILTFPFSGKSFFLPKNIALLKRRTKTMLKTHSLIEPKDLSLDEIQQLFHLADQIKKNPAQYQNACEGKLMGALFYEPSTRTRLSFESAMNRLGGRVVGFSDPASSSATKGETVADTARMVSGYADIMVMRHPWEGAPKVASLYSDIPVINAGDGGHNHPTQTLTDLYTFHTVFGRTDNLEIAVCGDLKFGRTVHSLVQAMSRYQGISFKFISPKELKVPSYLLELLQQTQVPYQEVSQIEDAITNCDVLYMTRIQKERFSDPAEYERLRDCYRLDNQKMKLAKENMIVMHPLPRVNEIATEVDFDSRAKYFRQARYGMFIRMALIIQLLEGGYQPKQTQLKPTSKSCKNPNCICNQQPEIQQMLPTSNGMYQCLYCDYIEK